jgi:hypothetical protein
MHERLAAAADALVAMPAILARSIEVIGFDDPPARVGAVAEAIAAERGLTAKLTSTEPVAVRFARVSRDRSGTARR